MDLAGNLGQLMDLTEILGNELICSGVPKDILDLAAYVWQLMVMDNSRYVQKCSGTCSSY